MRQVRLNWVGGEHDFAATIGNLRAIQAHCDAGPAEIYNRIQCGHWRVDDLFEVIRQGLIGGGMKSSDAGPMVLRLMENHPLMDFVVTAQAVLASALVGEEDDNVGGKTEGEAPPQESGASPASTALEQ